jgi:hypothetical protein
MAYPPRPQDPAVAWEPEWNVKIRVKSMTTSMMGMDGADMGGMSGADDADDMTDAPPADAATEQAAPAEQGKKKKKWNPLDVAKDVVKQLP